MKKLIRISLTLFLICALVAGALAGVNAITYDRIQENQLQKTREAIAAVLPGAREMSLVYTGNQTVRQVYAPAADSLVQGYAVMVAPSGFGGEIQMMVGIDGTGAVSGISIISHGETPGLGKVAADQTERGQAFRDSFLGKTDTVTLSDVDALSGATITSAAVAEGVNAALAWVKEG